MNNRVAVEVTVMRQTDLVLLSQVRFIKTCRCMDWLALLMALVQKDVHTCQERLLVLDADGVRQLLVVRVVVREDVGLPPHPEVPELITEVPKVHSVFGQQPGQLNVDVHDGSGRRRLFAAAALGLLIVSVGVSGAAELERVLTVLHKDPPARRFGKGGHFHLRAIAVNSGIPQHLVLLLQAPEQLKLLALPICNARFDGVVIELRRVVRSVERDQAVTDRHLGGGAAAAAVAAA